MVSSWKHQAVGKKLAGSTKETTALDDIRQTLRLIDPNELDKFKWHNMVIRRSYVARNLKPKNRTEFNDEITRYYQHHRQGLTRKKEALPEHVAYGEAAQILDHRYEGEYACAAKDAMRDSNRGMPGVLDTIAEGIQSMVIENYLAGVLVSQINPTDYDRKVILSKDLLTYAEVLLGIDHISKFELAPKLAEVLKQHPPLIERYRQGFW